MPYHRLRRIALYTIALSFVVVSGILVTSSAGSVALSPQDKAMVARVTNLMIYVGAMALLGALIVIAVYVMVEATKRVM